MHSGPAAISFVNNDANAISLFRDPTSREDTYDAFDDDRVSVTLSSLFDDANTTGPDRVMVAAADLGSFRNLVNRSIVWVRDGVVVAENGITTPVEDARDPSTTDPRYVVVTNAVVTVIIVLKGHHHDGRLFSQLVVSKHLMLVSTRSSTQTMLLVVKKCSQPHPYAWIQVGTL